LIFQGTIDALVPYSQSDSLASWLEKAGVPHDYHRLKGWPHTMDLAVKVNEYCQFYMDEFLKKYL
jgi:acetyl esterase/lipase